MTATHSPRRLHVGLTEQGKLHALAGEHRAALAHYREAMAVAVRAGEPEVFFRHSLECALESLELLGAFDEVLAYCERAIAHYHQRPPEHAVATRDLAHVHQRRAVVLLKRGEREAARADLATCLRLQPGGMPLAACLQRWLAGGLHFDVARIVAEQHRHQAFSVRRDTVAPERAIPLPAGAPGMSTHSARSTDAR
jgi:tetratricopeptide (TPR) repeat protein